MSIHEDSLNDDFDEGAKVPAGPGRLGNDESGRPRVPTGAVHMYRLWVPVGGVQNCLRPPLLPVPHGDDEQYPRRGLYRSGSGAGLGVRPCTNNLNNGGNHAI